MIRVVVAVLCTSMLAFVTVAMTTATVLDSLPPISDEMETYTGPDANMFVTRGMERFKRGRIEDSVYDFDKAVALDESKRPWMWQRGLSLYYLERYHEAATQFEADVAVNPNDTEEAEGRGMICRSVCRGGRSKTFT